ncbi:hypothetical protein ACNPM4_00120 [Microbacterium sp. AGC62]
MRRWRGFALAAVLMAVLTGCSATPEVDTDAVQDWMATQDSREVAGSLATLAGLASPLSDVVGEGGVTAAFDEPTAIVSVLFACFGPETMSADIALSGSDAGGSAMSQTIRTDDLVCDGEPQRIDMGMDAATEVTANGLGRDAVGAWSVVVVGES